MANDAKNLLWPLMEQRFPAPRETQRRDQAIHDLSEPFITIIKPWLINNLWLLLFLAVGKLGIQGIVVFPDA